VHRARIAGRGLLEDELADVMQQRADQQRVVVGAVQHPRDEIGRALRGHRVQAQVLQRLLPARDVLEVVDRARRGGDVGELLTAELADRVGDRRDHPLGGAQRVGRADRRNGQGEVGLHDPEQLRVAADRIGERVLETLARLPQRRQARDAGHRA
jgi:hypothetical protein